VCREDAGVAEGVEGGCKAEGSGAGVKSREEGSKS
jgi:hypothetical protein